MTSDDKQSPQSTQEEKQPKEEQRQTLLWSVDDVLKTASSIVQQRESDDISDDDVITYEQPAPEDDEATRKLPTPPVQLFEPPAPTPPLESSKDKEAPSNLITLSEEEDDDDDEILELSEEDEDSDEEIFELSEEDQLLSGKHPPIELKEDNAQDEEIFELSEEDQLITGKHPPAQEETPSSKHEEQTSQETPEDILPEPPQEASQEDSSQEVSPQEALSQETSSHEEEKTPLPQEASEVPDELEAPKEPTSQKIPLLEEPNVPLLQKDAESPISQEVQADHLPQEAQTEAPLEKTPTAAPPLEQQEETPSQEELEATVTLPEKERQQRDRHLKKTPTSEELNFDGLLALMDDDDDLPTSHHPPQPYTPPPSNDPPTPTPAQEVHTESTSSPIFAATDSRTLNNLPILTNNEQDFPVSPFIQESPRFPDAPPATEASQAPLDTKTKRPHDEDSSLVSELLSDLRTPHSPQQAFLPTGTPPLGSKTFGHTASNSPQKYALKHTPNSTPLQPQETDETASSQEAESTNTPTQTEPPTPAPSLIQPIHTDSPATPSPLQPVVSPNPQAAQPHPPMFSITGSHIAVPPSEGTGSFPTYTQTGTASPPLTGSFQAVQPNATGGFSVYNTGMHQIPALYQEPSPQQDVGRSYGALLGVAAGLALLFLLTGLVWPGWFFAMKPKNQVGIFNISSQPLGAKVFVNDEDIQKTTPTTLKRKPGRYTIRLERRGFIPRRETLQLHAGRTAVLNFELTKKPVPRGTSAKVPYAVLSVSSTPPNAQVWIDGEKQNKVTPALFRLTPGVHRIQMKRKGHKTFTKTLDLERGQQSFVEAELQKK